MIFSAILLIACSTDNDSGKPVIMSVKSDLYVIAIGDTTMIKCFATDDKPEDQLNYQWQINSEILPGNDNTLKWIAEAEKSYSLLKCTVRDQDDHQAEMAIMLIVVDSYDNVYQQAVTDASTPDTLDIYNHLSAISSSNSNLIWEGVPGHSRVLVSTYTKYAASYQNSIGDTLSTVWGINWVTVGQELKSFVNNSLVTENKLNLRIRQILGLPPTNQANYIVELWVYPNDLFRPARDPEIDDNVCQLYFPANVSPEHQNWFNENLLSSYGNNGYPWTQMGYTYDWGNPNSTIGLSEYCIKQNANVKVKSVSISSDYFQPE